MNDRHLRPQKARGGWGDPRRKPWHYYVDLFLLAGFYILLGVLVYLVPGALVRVLVGILCVFYGPGYALLAALYPGVGPIGLGQRLSASVGLSVVVSGLAYLLVSFSLGTSLSTSFGVIVLGTVAMVLVAGYRRHLMSPSERFVPRIHVRLPNWQAKSLLSKGLISAQVLAVFLLCLAAGRLLWVSNRTGPQFTEFYLLGPEGIAARYPEETVAGEPVNLILGVVNHEQGDTQYRIERVSGTGREEVARFHLSNEQSWEQTQAFTLIEPGENQKVEFLLYRGDEQEPHRSLHLWITVTEE